MSFHHLRPFSGAGRTRASVVAFALAGVYLLLATHQAPLLVRKANVLRKGMRLARQLNVVVEDINTLTEFGEYESTIVVPYFTLKNAKQSREKYIQWAEYLMCIEDPLVIFTNSEHVEMFKRLRQHAENRTLIVPMELDDMNFHGGNKFWGKLATTIETNNIYGRKMDVDVFKL